jgi:hypothetical protein
MGSEVPQQQQAVHVPTAASAADHPVWSEYNQRWFEIWHDGLHKGQVGTSSLTLITMVDMCCVETGGILVADPGSFA